MRKLLLFIIALYYSVQIIAQDQSHNFKIKDGDLIWQKVYESEAPQKEIVSYFKRSGKISDIEVSDTQLTGQLNSTEVHYKSYGKTRGSLPAYMSLYDVNGFLIINFKEGKYRVILKNIGLVRGKYNNIVQLSDKGILKDYAIKSRKNEFRKSFLKTPAGLYNFTFNNIFAVKKSEEDDW